MAVTTSPNDNFARYLYFQLHNYPLNPLNYIHIHSCHRSIRDKLPWNLNQNLKKIFEENAFENPFHINLSDVITHSCPNQTAV